MADLLDIAPSTAVEVVKINGQRITVRGLNADAIASIAARFPDLPQLISGGVNNIVPRLIQQLGKSIAPIIAAGCNYLGDERYEQAASRLVIEDQMKLFTAIIGLSFPNGVMSFAEAMIALREKADGGQKVIKVRLKKSLSASPPSSDAASRQTMQ
jgi:hypothetical protein